MSPEERSTAGSSAPATGDAVAASGSKLTELLEFLTSGAPPRPFSGAMLLILYVFLAGMAAWHHEPWFDEAQAWLIARDASLLEMATTVLRYEGHPPLWYLILAVPAKLGMPFRFLPLLSVAIATVGIAVLLKIPGVPMAVRLLAPFSYALLYQYSVIARSYVLIPLLLFLVAGSWRSRFERPTRFAVLLALLMHVSLHGAILAFAIFLSCVWAWNRRGRIPDFRRFIGPTVILAAAATLFIAILLPIPPDISIRQKLEQEWWQRLQTATTWGIDTAFVPSIPGSLLLAAAIVPWFFERRILVLAIGLWGGLTLALGIYLNVWHLGLYSCVILFAFALAGQSAEPRSPREARLRAVATAAVTIALASQIGEGIRAVRIDIAEPYSGSRAAAEALAQLPLDRVTLHGFGFPAIATQAYFEEPIFDNYGEPVWWRWSTSSPWHTERGGESRMLSLAYWLRSALDAQPDYLLLSFKFKADRILLQAMSMRPDYEMVAGFPGMVTWRGRFREHDTLILFVRTDSPAPRPAMVFDRSPQATPAR